LNKGEEDEGNQRHLAAPCGGSLGCHGGSQGMELRDLSDDDGDFLEVAGTDTEVTDDEKEPPPFEPACPTLCSTGGRGGGEGGIVA
jgi:hypothetical protein